MGCVGIGRQHTKETCDDGARREGNQCGSLHGDVRVC